MPTTMSNGSAIVTMHRLMCSMQLLALYKCWHVIIYLVWSVACNIECSLSTSFIYQGLTHSHGRWRLWIWWRWRGFVRVSWSRHWGSTSLQFTPSSSHWESPTILSPSYFISTSSSFFSYSTQSTTTTTTASWWPSSATCSPTSRWYVTCH